MVIRRRGGGRVLNQVSAIVNCIIGIVLYCANSSVNNRSSSVTSGSYFAANIFIIMWAAEKPEREMLIRIAT